MKARREIYKLALSLLVSLAANALALVAATHEQTPDVLQGAALFFLLPGEVCSVLFGANMISGPLWAWALTNAGLMAILLFAVARLLRASGSPPPL